MSRGRVDSSADGDNYEYRVERVLRGRESGSKQYWRSQGWEFVSEADGRALRRELTFRRPVPGRSHGAGKRVLAVLAAVLVLMMAGGVAWGVLGGRIGDTPPSSSSRSATTPSETPAETASESATASASPRPDQTSDPTSAAPSQSPREKPSATGPTASPTPATSSPAGPDYRVVVQDAGVGPAELTQYWVLVPDVDYSTSAYQEQVKALVTDVARREGSASVMVEVVTDPEIAEAEALSTQPEFVREHGEKYAIRDIPKKEVEGWVASYIGGFDLDTGQPSQAPGAYEIIWRPAATPQSETWKPQLRTR